MAAPDPTFVFARPQPNPLSIEYWKANPLIPWECGILLVKDIQHRYVASTHNFRLFSGVTHEELVGLSDLDMPWKEDADIYISHGNDTLAGMTHPVIETLNGLLKVNLLTKRNVIHDKNGMPAGTLSCSIEINNDIKLLNINNVMNSKVNVNKVNLTKSEIKILALLFEGLGSEAISLKIGISKESYYFHVHNLKRKFKVNSVNELILSLYRNGFNNVLP
ncbi:helix-turn-helix transcriptional regulator [Yersinia rochesterensis]|uniref:helix-turn-helix transcriptional regulator n=1 Tax=Yersinia rochesterensis TaxID=1604335 RepID=UPI00285365CC|nr:helix-turn-helix transcriptional regulator [Yersinia rochesterensis]MDR5020239.1 helix-turn-helix transcriptional regulator [Yersinia rochesterensis]